MKKRLLAALVCVALVVSLLPHTVRADNVSASVLYFDGTTLSIEDFPYGTREPYPKDGTWSAGDRKLTLKNFNFTTSAPTVLSVDLGVTLVLEGRNTLTSTYNGDGIHTYFVCGLHSTNQLTVRGSGTLTVTGGSGGSNYDSCGIFVANHDELKIESGTIEAKAGTSAVRSIGIQAGTITMTGGTLTAYGNTSALHTEVSGDCLSVGPAGVGKGFICSYSDHVEETDWSDKMRDGVYGAVSLKQGKDSEYYKKPSIRIGEVSAVSGTVKDTAGNPAFGFQFYINGALLPSYVFSAPTGEYLFYIENGAYTLSAEKERTIGTRSIAVSSAALTGQNIVLRNAPTPGITVSPAATFPLHGAPDDLTLLVGNTGNTPNRAEHFGSLEISSDNVNFTTVDPANYSLQYGSIHIGLKKIWLDTLALGTYTLRVNLNGVYAGLSPTVKLTVTVPDVNPDVPKTSDNATPVLWLGLMLLAGAGLAVSTVRRRKRRNG